MKRKSYLKQVSVISFAVLFFLTVVVSCSSENYYDEKTTARIYVDLLIIEESNLSGTDSVRIKQDEYFREHNFDKSKYERSFSIYELDEKKWNVLFNEAERIIDSLKTASDQEPQSSS